MRVAKGLCDVNGMTFGKHLRVGAGSSGANNLIREWELSVPPRSLGKGVGLEAESIANGQ